MPNTPDARARSLACMNACRVALSDGKALLCPAYPEDCDWVNVLAADGGVIHRVRAEQLAGAPAEEITRLADALSDGRPEQPELPPTVIAGEPQDYGLESAVTAAISANTLRVTSAGPEVDYLRVCSPGAAELGYWVCEEFTDDAADALGAVIGALAGGTTGLAYGSDT
jgi:hypothetical protein